MKVLLDTCTLLWLATDTTQLSPRVRKLLEAPDTEALLSAASGWEIAIKYARGRLALPVPPGQFVPAARVRYGLDALSIDEDSALHIAKLPALHADPFDRMLVSQAIVHGLTILTPDPLVTQYPARTAWE